MPDTPSPDLLTTLAPDARSLAAAAKLIAPSRWPTLGRSGRLLWGTCQGSAAEPYQTAADLGGPATVCSCPSRKFPCKHALALLLIYQQQPAHLPSTEPPPWAADWLTKRDAAAGKPSAPAPAAKPIDPLAQANRIATRSAKIDTGFTELERWLQDLVRGGLVDAKHRLADDARRMAARLIDARAPGAAREVEALLVLALTGDATWAAQLLARLGRLQMLITAWRRYAALSPAQQADVYAAVGLTLRTEEVLTVPPVHDVWLTLGRRLTVSDRLQTQWSWLLGTASGRPALSLAFAYGNDTPIDRWMPGTIVAAALHYYPGSAPLRVVAGAQAAPTQPADAQRVQAVAAADFAAALRPYNQALARNPWCDQAALLVHAVTPLIAGDGWAVRDRAGAQLPLAPRWPGGWTLLALSGGHPLTLAAEWDGALLWPLGAWADGRYVAL